MATAVDPESMRQVQLTVTPADPTVHPFFELTAGDGPIKEALSLHCNVADQTRPTYLFGIRGPPERLAGELSSQSGIVDYQISPDRDGMSYVTLQLEQNAFGRAIMAAFATDNLTLVLPVIYRDGHAQMELVGDHTALQQFVDALPADLDVALDTLGAFTDGSSAASILTDRQRQAVRAGLDLGYYETPSRATNEDVAERLGCAPSTASELLSRAEDKLIKAMLDRP